MEDVTALVLAAGKGTRMKSALPKVLHKVGGIPMIGQVLQAVKAIGTRREAVVVGFGADAVKNTLPAGRSQLSRRSSWVRVMRLCRRKVCWPAKREHCWLLAAIRPL